MPRAKQRTPELRDRILQAAVALLADDGVAGFTTRTVARGADTSVPAVYELFGDKAGLVREVFFEGFRQLRARLEATGVTDDPRADLERGLQAYRAFVAENPVLAEVMFSRPFADFDPGADDLAAGIGARHTVVDATARAVEAGQLAGDPVDIAHVLVALAQGLAAQEAAGLLGSTPASIDRRWALAITSTLDGLRP